MISAMRKLAETFLETRSQGVDSTEKQIYLLCEDVSGIEKAYVLERKDDEVAVLKPVDVQSSPDGFPFIKVAPNAAYITPVFKVEAKKQKSESKLSSTLKQFGAIANDDNEDVIVREYFREIFEICSSKCLADELSGQQVYDKKLLFSLRLDFQSDLGNGVLSQDFRKEFENREMSLSDDVTITTEEGGTRWRINDIYIIMREDEALNVYGKSTTLHQAIELVSNRKHKDTVLLAVKTSHGLPGEAQPFLKWLKTTALRTQIYETKQTPRLEEKCSCPLCGTGDRLFPNALAGAGLNFMNKDFPGAFPGVGRDHWKRYGLCLECSDLLYIYKNHVASAFIGSVAGSKALMIPYADTSHVTGQTEFQSAVQNIGGKRSTAVMEEDLLDDLKGNAGVATITILWGEFGQKYENLRGSITHVLPSRLAELSDINREFNTQTHNFFPQMQSRLSFDLHLNAVRSILYRPGGKKAQRDNESQQFATVLQDIARAVYLRQTLPQQELWKEINRTTYAYMRDLLLQDNRAIVYRILHEQKFDFSRTKAKSLALTLNSYTRHVYMLLRYLDRTEVMTMGNQQYEPQEDFLKPVFADGKGIDTEGKAFTFLLGALFGKVVAAQARRGVSVASNALKWLRGMNLRAADLPDLYVKVREKLLVYGTEGSKEVQAVVQEMARLGKKMGTDIVVPDEQVPFFLLIGQTLSRDIMPPKDEHTE